MANVNVVINGIAGSVPAGTTVLEAARQLHVDIPTLCDHPAIQPIGACRMCLVEIEKQRTLQPACTFPVSEGIVVKTDTPATMNARRFVLQLLFSERNHFCMFCQMSGSCELQTQAYKHGLDSWRYDRAFPVLPLDATRQYFIMDHNRCILCRRCIRACDQLVGNATLGLKHRGANTMIIADMDVPFGESSCISCGTCLQVCPTGALIDRASAYLGATAEVKRVKSTCTHCSIGCGTELVMRDDRVIRIEGDWTAEPNHGLICEMGRFQPLNDKRAPVTKPMVKEADGWHETSLQAALERVATNLKTGKVTTVVSGLATNEAAQIIAKRFPGAKQLMEGQAPAVTSSPLKDMDAADLFIVVNTDVAHEYPVASFAIKRSVHLRGARLYLVGDTGDSMQPWTSRSIQEAQIDALLPIIEGAQNPVIICGKKGEALAMKIAKVVTGIKIVDLAPAGNTMGLVQAGIRQQFSANGFDTCYILAAEAQDAPQELLEACAQAKFTAVQASYKQPWMDIAQVILPTPVSHLKCGTFVNFEGKTGVVNAAAACNANGEAQVLEQLANLL
ncbi:MAG: 2Fe-2S iron-sulfur cluster-binding protein [Chloroflexi bacterium]|nr:2Fe-2S iron-sulfur cluster-binding protein [Chloroflexota bacterium]